MERREEQEEDLRAEDVDVVLRLDPVAQLLSVRRRLVA